MFKTTPHLYRNYVLPRAAPAFVREDPPTPETFTQDQVNSIIAKERGRLEAKFGDYDALKEAAGKVGDLETAVQALKDEAELKGKNEEEQAKIIAIRAAEQSQAEIDSLKQQVLTLTGERDDSVGNLRSFQVTTHVGAALQKAGVLGAAAKHALAAMMSDSKIEMNDDGSIKSISLGDVPQADLDKAASTYLAQNAHFKAAKPGGGGATTPTSGGNLDGNLDDHTADDLAAAGWNQKPAGLQSGDPFDKQAT